MYGQIVFGVSVACIGVAILATQTVLTLTLGIILFCTGLIVLMAR